MFEESIMNIHVIDVSSYCKIDSETNESCLKKELEFFSYTFNSRWMRDTSSVLFLNKIDLFREKIKNYPISDYFPDYKGNYCKLFFLLTFL